jgi:hypothetical protein
MTACQKVWEDTRCVRKAGGCYEWSPHLDWYENLDNVINEIREEMTERSEILHHHKY